MAKKGFTLLEVLIALVILSITFVWLLQAENQGINMAMRSKFITTATLLAQEHISELISSGDPVSTDSTEGDFGKDTEEYFEGYTYKETIELTPLDGYYKYTLNINWGGEKSSFETQFITYLASF